MAHTCTMHMLTSLDICTAHTHTHTPSTPERERKKRYNKLSNKYQFSLRKHKFRIHNNILPVSPHIFAVFRSHTHTHTHVHTARWCFFRLRTFYTSRRLWSLRHDWVGASSAPQLCECLIANGTIRWWCECALCDGIMRICLARWRWIRFLCTKINIYVAFESMRDPRPHRSSSVFFFRSMPVAY